MNPTHAAASLYAVAELSAAYEVDETTAKRLVADNDDSIQAAIRNRSHAYYPADQIASIAGLTEREDFDPER
jgi:hypothetical protein